MKGARLKKSHVTQRQYTQSPEETEGSWAAGELVEEGWEASARFPWRDPAVLGTRQGCWQHNTASVLKAPVATILLQGFTVLVKLFKSAFSLRKETQASIFGELVRLSKTMS